MSDIDKETLQKKKNKLEAELKNIQNELDDSLDKVKSDVSSSLDPLEHIRRHPLPAVGVAVLFGFLVGKDDEPVSQSASDDSESKREKITSTLGYEVKRLITRKAFSMISDYIDDMFHD